MHPRPDRLPTYRLASLGVALGLLVTGCGGDNTAPDDPGAVASVTIESIGDTLLLGETKPLRFTLRDGGGARLPSGTVAWSSSDPAVLDVSGDGVVSAIGQGSALIIATSGAAADTVTFLARRLRFDRVYAGLDHLCGLESSGEAWCWGATGISGSYSYSPKPPPSPLPQRAAVGSRFSSLALGVRFTCGIRLAGDVVCWGANASGQLGDGSTRTRHLPVLVSGITNATALIAGQDHACALIAGGTVRCWGSNEFGQLGDGTYVDRPTPIQVVSLGAVSRLSGGWAHTCAVGAGGPVCWGNDQSGELGHDTTYNRVVPVRAGAVAELSPAYSALVSGAYNTCGLGAGTAYCWGMLEAANDFTEGNFGPTPRGGGRQFTAIFDDAIQCGLEADGALWCWDIIHDPVRFPGTTPIVDAAIAYSQMCVLDAAGSVRCWNPINGGGAPGSVTGAPPLVAIAAGGGTRACGLSAAGELWCWAPFVTANGGTVDALPATTGGTPQSFVSIWDGMRQVCALTAAGDAWCSSTSASSLAPVPFASAAAGFGFTALAAGDYHLCGVTGAGAAWCGGENNHGQLGDGTTASRPTPVLVQGGHQFSTITAGFGHTCARTSGGEAWCWGMSELGQMGDGGRVASPAPIAVSGSPAITGIVGTGGITCGLQQGGAALCWPSPRGSTQTTFAGPAPFVALAAGGAHACGLDAGGIAYCWGSTDGGVLGNGQDANGQQLTPQPVSGGLRFATIAAGIGGTTCGITVDGNTWCWGPNGSGALGSPHASGIFASAIPVRVYGQE